jgi:hypothetical protein
METVMELKSKLRENVLEPYVGVNNRGVEMFKKLMQYLFAMKTSYLVLLPLIVSLVPILILISMGTDGYQDGPAQFTLSGLIFFLWGCTGLPIMIRKEVPGLASMHGWAAVVEGFVFLSIGWGIALGFAILLLKSLL